MGNLCAGGIGCIDEVAEFERFHGTGGEVRLLIVALDYEYSPGNELTGIVDGKRMERIAAQANIQDVTVMYDTESKSDPSFPNSTNVTNKIQEIGRRCRPNDFFVFFYAGHGENVQDRPPLDEDDGMDEAFVLPGPRGELVEKYFLVDDQFVETLENSVSEDCRILLIFDCCHSATLADIDSHVWRHRICSFSACQDDEESKDTGKGGVLTLGIESAMMELSLTRGEKEYSLQTMFDSIEKYTGKLSQDQVLELQFANMNPELTPWPLPRPWWKHFDKK